MQREIRLACACRWHVERKAGQTYEVLRPHCGCRDRIDGRHVVEERGTRFTIRQKGWKDVRSIASGTAVQLQCLCVCGEREMFLVSPRPLMLQDSGGKYGYLDGKWLQSGSGRAFPSLDGPPSLATLRVYLMVLSILTPHHEYNCSSFSQQQSFHLHRFNTRKSHDTFGGFSVVRSFSRPPRPRR